jgi:hypothetical protein
MATSLRVLPELRRLLSKVTAFDALSSSHSRNSSINKRNRRRAHRLYLSISHKPSHNLHHNRPRSNNSNNTSNSRRRPRSSSNSHQVSMRAHICTATPPRSNRSLPTNTTIVLHHLEATNLSKLLP